MQYKDKNTEKLIKAFGDVAKNNRIGKNKSIRLLCDEFGLDSGNYCRIENGKIEPKLTMLWRIAEALDIPLSGLIKKLEDNLGKDFYIIDK